MKTTNTLQDTLSSFTLPSYQEIPDVGLYLDQVAKYINGFLKDFPEMNVTNSMISNYAKQKMIDRVNKKTYTRDQISILFFIVMTKSVLSIDHIRQILNEIRQEGTSFEQWYTFFRSALHEMLSSVCGSMPVMQKEKSVPEQERMLRNVAVAIAHKMYLERYFSQNEQE